MHRGLELFAGVGDGEADGLGGVKEAGEVFFGLEDAAGVNADAFEDAVTVEEAVVVDADLCVGFVGEFSVDPDFWGH